MTKPYSKYCQKKCELRFHSHKHRYGPDGKLKPRNHALEWRSSSRIKKPLTSEQKIKNAADKQQYYLQPQNKAKRYRYHKEWIQKQRAIQINEYVSLAVNALLHILKESEA